MNLVFHHIGIACDNIEDVMQFIESTFTIIKKTAIMQHDNHGVAACLITTSDGTNIELVSGKTVEKFVKKRQYLYHNCWEVDNLTLAIEHFVKNGAMLISESKPSELFQNRNVVFLLTSIGMIELLESSIDVI